MKSKEELSEEITKYREIAVMYLSKWKKGEGEYWLDKYYLMMEEIRRKENEKYNKSKPTQR